MKKNQIGAVLILEFAVIAAVFVMDLVVCTGYEQGLHYLQAYLDIPTFFCILVFTLPMLFASGAGKDFGRAFRIGKQTFSIAQMRKSLEAVKLMQKLIMYGSLFTMGIAFIVVLHSMEIPASIGPTVAIICLTLVYASILEVLLLPLHLNVQNALTDAMDIIDEEE